MIKKMHAMRGDKGGEPYMLVKEEKNFQISKPYWYVETINTIYRCNNLTRVMNLWRLANDSDPVVVVGSAG